MGIATDMDAGLDAAQLAQWRGQVRAALESGTWRTSLAIGLAILVAAVCLACYLGINAGGEIGRFFGRGRGHVAFLILGIISVAIAGLGWQASRQRRTRLDDLVDIAVPQSWNARFVFQGDDSVWDYAIEFWPQDNPQLQERLRADIHQRVPFAKMPPDGQVTSVLVLIDPNTQTPTLATVDEVTFLFHDPATQCRVHGEVE